MKRFTKSIFSFTAALLMLVLFVNTAMGASVGDYRTAASGNWSTLAIWQVCTVAGTPGTWAAAAHTPTSADGVITILNTHTVTVTANVTADQVVVDAGGQITVNNGITFTVANGTGTDLTVSGTVRVDGTITGPNEIVINTGGAMNVSGSVSTVGNGKLTVNSSANLTLTGTATVTISSVSTLTISGTLTMSGSSKISVDRGNGGTVGTVESGGLIAMSGTATFSNISGASGRTFSFNSGSTLRMGPDALLNGTGEFDINSGATFEIGSTAGITSAGASGNVQSSFRSYATGANYTYNGTAAQNTGNGLPATVNNLTFNNTGGAVTFDAARAITNNFSITTGSVANLGTFTHSAGTLTLGGSGTLNGSWGSTSSSATHQNNIYFAATTGIVNVTTNTCNSLNAPITGGDKAICNGQTIPALTVTVGTGETADWYTASSGGTLLLAGNTSYTPNGAGTYYAEARNTTTGCFSATRTGVTLTINPLPTPVISGPTAACANSTGNVYSTPNVVGHTYSWAISGGTIIGSTTGNSITVTWGAAGSGWVKVTETITSTTCAVTTAQYNITINPLPTPVISGPTAACANSTGNVYSTPNIVGHTYSWAISGGTIIGSTTGNSITVTWGASGSGWVQVTETITATTCAVTTAQYNVTINPLSAPIISGPTVACANSTGNIYSTPNVIGHTYSWTISGGTIIGPTTDNSITVTWGAAGTGWVQVTETITATTCAITTAQYNVTINPLPTPVITGPTAACANSTGNVYSTPNVVGNTYSWAISGGTIIGSTTGNSITVTWGAAGSGWVQVTETITSTTCAVTTAQYTVTINSCAKVSVQNGNWSDANTWDPTGAPTATDNVTVNHAVTVSNNPLTSPAVCRDLTINSGKSLTINSGQALTVNGTLTNNAGNSGLVIISDGSGTGSLIESSGASATVQLYLTGATTGSWWHIISSPVTNATANVFLGSYLRKYNEPAHAFQYLTSTTEPLTPMKGFFAWVNSNSTKVFSGTLNTGTHSIGVTRTWDTAPDPDAYDGWNMVGNPYPSAVDVSQLTYTGVEPAAYFWDRANGNYKVYTTGGGGTHSQYAPPMQGFAVHCNSSANPSPNQNSGTVGFSNSARTHTITESFWKSTASVPNVFRMKAQGVANAYSDELSVYFNPERSDNYEPGFDALKFRGNADAPQIYTLVHDTTVTVNALAFNSKDMVVPMGFYVSLAGNYTLTASNLVSFADTISVTLEDLKLNVTQDLKSNPVYNFTYATTDDPNRFRLVFTNLNQECIKCNGHEIVVDQNVTVNFNTNPPSCTGDPDLLPFFSWDKSGGPTADKWFARFDLGRNKLVIASGASINVSKVGTGNNLYAPGLRITGDCHVQMDDGSHIIVESMNKQAGDISVNVHGNILINGEIRNEVTGTNGMPGAIVAQSKCGEVNVGANGRIFDLGLSSGGNQVSLLTCSDDLPGDITISGLVKAYSSGNVSGQDATSPRIKVVSANGAVTVNANTAEPLYDEFSLGGVKYDIWGGLLSWVRDNAKPGTVWVQAAHDVTVRGHGTDPTAPVRPSFGAITAKATGSSSPGGLVDVRSTGGKIYGYDRSFDVSGKNLLSVNYANIRLLAEGGIALSRPGNSTCNPVVDASAGSGKGGRNDLRSFKGSIEVGTNAQVSATGTAVQGTNSVEYCTSFVLNGTVVPAPVITTECSEDLEGIYDCDGNELSAPVVRPAIIINNTLPPDGLLIYPNPAGESFTLRVKNETSQGSILTLQDLSGKEVFHSVLQLQEGVNTYPVSLAGIPDGMYIVRLQTGTGVRQLKLIINR